MLTKICETCKKEFKTYIAWERKGEVKYCSRICSSNSRRGKKIPWLDIIPKKRGKENYWWKGDNASYEAIHMWLSRWYKKEKCENCNSTQRLEWVNINGQYIRDRKQFVVLCLKCHRQRDKKNPKTKLKNTRLILKLTNKGIRKILKPFSQEYT